MPIFSEHIVVSGRQQSSISEHSVASAQAFLRWQFGRNRADWSRVHASDIWAFARHFSTGVKPVFAKARLGHLRRFLSFVQLTLRDYVENARPKVTTFNHVFLRQFVLTLFSGYHPIADRGLTP
jgi:hypothetical protein